MGVGWAVHSYLIGTRGCYQRTETSTFRFIYFEARNQNSESINNKTMFTDFTAQNGIMLVQNYVLNVAPR